MYSMYTTPEDKSFIRSSKKNPPLILHLIFLLYLNINREPIYVCAQLYMFKLITLFWMFSFSLCLGSYPESDHILAGIVPVFGDPVLTVVPDSCLFLDRGCFSALVFISVHSALILWPKVTFFYIVLGGF